MRADPQTAAAVRGVVEGMLALNTQRELDDVMKFVPNDDDTVWIGTAEGEFAQGPEAVRAILEEQLRQTDHLELTVENVQVSAAGDVAWLYADMVARWSDDDGEHIATGGRVTMVLEQRGGRWFAMQLHTSVADPAVPEGGHLPGAIAAVATSVRADRPDIPANVLAGGTVTLLFSDIEDSTGLNVSVGDDRYVEILRDHHALVRAALEAHGGYEVKSEGDGFMLAFPSARAALRCAIEIQRRHELAITDAQHRFAVRIGLHTGEPVAEADDFFGTHVVLAARVASLASGGEILVSSLLRDLVESSGEFELTAREPAALKGLEGEHVTYAVRWVP